MNCVFLRGNVGCDPRIKNFDNGGKIAEFTLATTERGYKTRDGREIPDVTDWHQIVVKQSGMAGVVEKHVKKGTSLLIRGKLKTRSYQDNSGQTRYVTEVIVEDMELLGSRREQAPAPAPEYTPSNVDDMPL